MIAIYIPQKIWYYDNIGKVEVSIDRYILYLSFFMHFSLILLGKGGIFSKNNNYVKLVVPLFERRKK